MLFALFAGCPLIIIGTTGPVLLYDEVSTVLLSCIVLSCTFLLYDEVSTAVPSEHAILSGKKNGELTKEDS